MEPILMESGETLTQEDLFAIRRNDPSYVPAYRTFTERTFLGIGCHHKFVNNTTQALAYVTCTIGEYNTIDASNPPVLSGHTWVSSAKDVWRVNSPDESLGEDEYCINNGVVVANLSGFTGYKKSRQIELTDIVGGQIDENLWQ